VIGGKNGEAQGMLAWGQKESRYQTHNKVTVQNIPASEQKKKKRLKKQETAGKREDGGLAALRKRDRER